MAEGPCREILPIPDRTTARRSGHVRRHRRVQLGRPGTVRAAGFRRAQPAPVPEARDQLTAQELQIAQLAAYGLWNREIGQRLYLSHRTISTHLYRVFPKLGVTSRAELGAALASGAQTR